MKKACLVLIMILSICYNSTSQIPTGGLVGYYPFNGNANDESGNGHDGTVYGAVLTTDRFGNPNSAYYFDGNDDYIQASSFDEVLSSESRSVGVWAKLLNFNPGWASRIYCFGDGSTGGGTLAFQGELLSFPPNEGVAIGNNGSRITFQANNVADSLWHFYTWVFDSTIATNISEVNIYQDGVLLFNIIENYIPFPSADEINTTIGNIIGCTFPGHGYLHGEIDDFRIYNRVITQQEIDILYHEGGWDDIICDFSASPLIGETPLLVQFTDASSGSPTSWEWDFQNDGTIDSYVQNPIWTYNEVGYYSVFLKVGDESTSDSLIKVNYIYVSQFPNNCPGTPTVSYGGQTYNTVLIGNQCWMKENLNIGTRINGNLDQTNNEIVEKYCFNDDEQKCDVYGGLYQWREIMKYDDDTTSQGICPNGWHIPTDHEWKVLEGIVDSHYGSSNPIWNATRWRGYDAGINIKSDYGWGSNGNGLDIYDFTALSTGYHSIGGYFFGTGNRGYFWTSSKSSDVESWKRGLSADNDAVWRSNTNYSQGYSLRCIKNPGIINYSIQTFSEPLAGGNTSGGGLLTFGQQCTVTATPNIDWNFISWTENSVIVSLDQNYTFTVNSNRDLVANFSQDQLYSVITNSNPPNGGITSGYGSYPPNDQVTVTVSASQGYDFVDWTENSIQVSTNYSYTFQIIANRNLTANFVLKQYNITVNSDPIEGGTVSGGSVYYYGLQATVSASQNPTWNFIKWTENDIIVSLNEDYSFTVTNNRDLVAIFSQDVLYSVITRSRPHEGGTTTGEGTYNEFDNVTVTATTNADWVFERWTENEIEVSTNPVYQFSIASNRNLWALFSMTDSLNLTIVTSTPDSICDGDTVFLEAIVTGGIGSNYQYSWHSIPSIFTSDQAQIYSMPDENIWYCITADDGVNHIKDSIYFSVSPRPQAHVILKSPPPYVLICPDSGYIYRWTFNGMDITGANKQFYYPGEAGLSKGDYRVEVTNEWDCTTMSDIFTFNYKSLEVYPNPNDGSFTLTYNISEFVYPEMVIINDMFGKTVISESVSVAPSTEWFEHKVSGMKTGVYLIRVVFSNKSVLSKKIVVL